MRQLIKIVRRFILLKLSNQTQVFWAEDLEAVNLEIVGSETILSSMTDSNALGLAVKNSRRAT